LRLFHGKRKENKERPPSLLLHQKNTKNIKMETSNAGVGLEEQELPDTVQNGINTQTVGELRELFIIHVSTRGGNRAESKREVH